MRERIDARSFRHAHAAGRRRHSFAGQVCSHRP
jgi:hypothetical protein